MSASSPAGFDPAALDLAPPRDFVAALTPLFEGAPGFLWRLAAARPFGSAEQLFRRARQVAHNMPEPLQVELLDAHPRLGAPPGSVSALSFREQGYDQEAALDRLNRAYEERFGFRYCVFVAGRPRAALIPGFETALGQERDDELHRGIDAVLYIALDRASAVAAGRASGTVSP